MAYDLPTRTIRRDMWLMWHHAGFVPWRLDVVGIRVAKSKSKNILVRMISQAGTGFAFNTKRSRLREKLTLLHYDPIVKQRVLFVEQKKIRSL
nr:39S ribosomal protein L33, mitochondrial isoform X1 [Microcebus murinus]